MEWIWIRIGLCCLMFHTIIVELSQRIPASFVWLAALLVLPVLFFAFNGKDALKELREAREKSDYIVSFAATTVSVFLTIYLGIVLLGCALKLADVARLRPFMGTWALIVSFVAALLVMGWKTYCDDFKSADDVEKFMERWNPYRFAVLLVKIILGTLGAILALTFVSAILFTVGIFLTVPTALLVPAYVGWRLGLHYQMGMTLFAVGAVLGLIGFILVTVWNKRRPYADTGYVD